MSNAAPQHDPSRGLAMLKQGKPRHDPVEARHQGMMLALLVRRIEEAMDSILQHV